jgi:hypothetical protein
MVLPRAARVKGVEAKRWDGRDVYEPPGGRGAAATGVSETVG